MSTKAFEVWKQSKPVVQISGKKVAASRPAEMFMKRNGLLPHFPYFFKPFRYWKKPLRNGPDLDLDGYFLAGIHEISGHGVGAVAIPLTNSGLASPKADQKVVEFGRGGEVLNSAIRVLDLPNSKSMHVCPDVLSGLTVAQVTGQRTWASPRSTFFEYIELPRSLEQVWVWKSHGADGTEGVHADHLVSRLLADGVSLVNVIELRPDSGFNSWEEVYKGLELFNPKLSREDRLNQIKLVSNQSEVTSFGLTKMA